VNTQEHNTPYRVLSLRYRPKRFKELVGQDLLCRLIREAFVKNRLGAAFLLNGIRGVGKTTIARLLGKILNCNTPQIEEKFVEPCGVCVSCQAVDDGTHSDIVEIDGASYTSVEDIRRVLESCHYGPSIGAYRVFIVDEVHMLSKSAFNALLKTLEEPPLHVKFIFATTEVEKIPLTVISRCFRFDLKRIETDLICSHLKNLCVREGVSAERRALTLVAEHGQGSLRDALSLLEQALLLALEDGHPENVHSQNDCLGEDKECGVLKENQTEVQPRLTDTLVESLLGLSDQKQALEVLNFINQGEAKNAIQVARKSYDAGRDALVFLDQLARLVHHFSCVKVGDMKAEEVYAEAIRAQAQALEAQIDLPALARLWQMLLKGRGEIAVAPLPQLALEMVLIRLAYATQLPTPESLMGAMKDKTSALFKSIPFAASEKALLPERPSGIGVRDEAGIGTLSCFAQERGGMLTQSVRENQTTNSFEARGQNTKNSKKNDLKTKRPEENPNLKKRHEKGHEGVVHQGFLIQKGVDVLKALEMAREGLLYSYFLKEVEVVSIEGQCMKLKGAPELPKDFHKKVEAVLCAQTGKKWTINITYDTEVSSLSDKQAATLKARDQALITQPFFQNVQTFLKDLRLLKVVEEKNSA